MAYEVDYSPAVAASARKAGALAGLGGLIGGTIREGRETRKSDIAREELKGLASRAMAGDEAAQDELAYTSPEINAAIMQRIGAKSEQQQKATIYDLAEVTSLHRSGQQEEALNYFDRRIEAIEARGGDPRHTKAMRDMYAADPEKGGQYIGMALQSMISPKEFAKMAGPSIDEDVKVGAQEILEDGTIIQSTARGPVVYSPTGEKLKGTAAADAIKIARAEKVSNLRKAAGGKKAATLEEELRLKGQVEADVISAKDAAKISTKAFERLENINTNIRNLDEGIQLLEDGAETGVVEKMLPSVRKNSIKLDNLQGRLGLDVLHSTTFGALSAAELKFALSTALPTGLQPEALKDWMIQKRDAQDKLADYIEASAIFLGTPGNTVKDWMVLQREKRLERQGGQQEQPATPATPQPASPQELSDEDLLSIALGKR
jgi:hypothetical protein